MYLAQQILGYRMCFDSRLGQNTDTGEQKMQILTARPPSLDIQAGYDPCDIEMATLFETFKSFISYMDKSRKSSDSKKKAILDLAGNNFEKGMIDAQGKCWLKRQYR